MRLSIIVPTLLVPLAVAAIPTPASAARSQCPSSPADSVAPLRAKIGEDEGASAFSDARALDYSNGPRDASAPGWLDPRIHGGSMLDLVANGMREPINVIISGRSDPYILSDAGLRDYIRSIGFSFECLDLHVGDLQRADLGDGRGWKTEMFEYRQTNMWDPGRWVGSCTESLFGGNHFRVWKQYGPATKTGAWFLAVSKEKDLRHQHTIDKDGYNVGRDLLVANAEAGGKWREYEWRATTEWVEGLLPAGKHGINHHVTQDGRTAVLTVERVVPQQPPHPGPASGSTRFPQGWLSALGRHAHELLHAYAF
ncbi:hypothetical protein K437DRAFT_38705 [Tilletiaria anomala UBC 951]|uniref:Uncharacterized protein n=1 Tax=Tilletiaria anomala (strain ATCC 24038 / CBS 436.72 / UBC 951) TaxID=1037660 RepID=A0A066WM15_TILAU|nr:uncharacterized protein K437DRAFT_38705 [Tilletiaria anomala UBC 951]KDN52044.1 hypothetical protein K437DRAFT_38705 [Tilletiaria anomala UBC 951]